MLPGLQGRENAEPLRSCCGGCSRGSGSLDQLQHFAITVARTELIGRALVNCRSNMSAPGRGRRRAGSECERGANPSANRKNNEMSALMAIKMMIANMAATGHLAVGAPGAAEGPIETRRPRKWTQRVVHSMVPRLRAPSHRSGGAGIGVRLREWRLGRRILLDLTLPFSASPSLLRMGLTLAIRHARIFSVTASMVNQCCWMSLFGAGCRTVPTDDETFRSYHAAPGIGASDFDDDALRAARQHGFLISGRLSLEHFPARRRNYPHLFPSRFQLGFCADRELHFRAGGKDDERRGAATRFRNRVRAAEHDFRVESRGARNVGDFLASEGDGRRTVAPLQRVGPRRRTFQRIGRANEIQVGDKS